MAYMIDRSVSEFLQWTSSDVTPLQPVAYARSQSSAERASSIPRPSMAELEMRRRRHASPLGQFVGESSRRGETRSNSPPNHTGTRDTKSCKFHILAMFHSGLCPLTMLVVHSSVGSVLRQIYPTTQNELNRT